MTCVVASQFLRGLGAMVSLFGGNCKPHGFFGDIDIYIYICVYTKVEMRRDEAVI